MQKLQAGESLEQALAPYPQWADDLRPFLEAAQAARWYGATMPIPPGAQERGREAFVQAGIARAGARGGRWSPARPRSFSMAFLALVLLLVMGAVGAVGASAQALPGDPLYPVKIAAERTRLLLVSSPAQRLRLEQSFDQERVDEVEVLIQLSLNRQVNFAGGLVDMQPGMWRVGDLTVLLPDDAQVIGQIEQGIYVDVEGSLQPGGAVVASKVQARRYRVEGKLLQRQPGQWVIDGVTVLVTPDTVVQGNAVVGSTVRAEAFLLLDNTFKARLVEVTAAPPEIPEPTLTSTPDNSVRPAVTEPQTTSEPRDAAPKPATATKTAGGESYEDGQDTPEIREQKDTPEPSGGGEDENDRTPEATRDDGGEDSPKPTDGQEGDHKDDNNNDHPESTPNPTDQDD